ncbi:hypothetical protein BT67DRAFT_380856 [Trichocladium antarcticum]|uniref:Coupling of ubiquitin conjugation to ER degradation protein 1 n=1 Tax=Trichocladium antarcticum TaxID=1450529 RepID=A0AAN6ZDH2_9PEZI|nr:hypothetical protein BT67DRAFT_380856 [Trichocladium antarcticum]
MSDHQDQQINLPSLVVILVLSGLILRYLFFSSSSPPGSRVDPVVLMRSREAAVERIQQMFPQAERRAVLWDLQRTGGSVAATTERILAGRMETPPVSFQPPPPPGGSSDNNGAPTAKPAGRPVQPDLITRYNLKDKVATPVTESAASGARGDGQAGAKAWSSNKEERQSLLQKRRDQMILEARRKMEAKIAAEKAAGGR